VKQAVDALILCFYCNCIRRFLCNQDKFGTNRLNTKISVEICILDDVKVKYFNVKRTIWLRATRTTTHVELSEHRLQEISIAKKN